MKTVCFLVKIDLPEGVKPYHSIDATAGGIEYAIRHRRFDLFGGGDVLISATPVPCAFNQPGALCKHTFAELNEAAEREAA